MSNSIEYFDHILGEQDHESNPADLRILKRIIEAQSGEYNEDEKMNIQRMGLHQRMLRYLSEPISQIIPVGTFLNELLEIYEVKKTKFAALIEYESPNLHAILKGRRRINNKLASKIGAMFEIDPQLWMFIDAKNELAKFRQINDMPKVKYSLELLKSAR